MWLNILNLGAQDFRDGEESIDSEDARRRSSSSAVAALAMQDAGARWAVFGLVFAHVLPLFIYIYTCAYAYA